MSHPDTGEREAQIFSCLGPQVAESVSFSILVAGMEEEIETKLSEDEKSCVREAFADTDVPALITTPAARRLRYAHPRREGCPRSSAG